MKGRLIKKKDNWYNLYQGEIGIGSTYEELQGYKLSLENCQAIELGYDLEGEAIHYSSEFGDSSPYKYSDEQVGRLHGFIDGFQKALEILGDKKFTEEDMNKFAEYVEYQRGSTISHLSAISNGSYLKRHLEKKESIFDVEIETIIQNSTQVPKLDENGCIILKRI
jgi:hypothetical protein